MFEDIQLIYMNVKILKFWSLLYDQNWRRYVCLTPATFLVFTQFYYMFMTHEGIDAIIRNSYMLVLWFNTIIRAYILIYDREKYEHLIGVLEKHFYDLMASDDPYVDNLLSEVNSMGKAMSKGNLFLGLLTCIGFALYPLFAVDKVLPFGSMIPGVNEYESPFYELWYVFQMVITPMGCCMYIPYTTLIVTFIMFGIVLCKTLQHRLRTLYRFNNNPEQIERQVIQYIKFQKEIIDYIETVNRLTTFIFLLEFIAFGALLCALLFLLIIATPFMYKINTYNVGGARIWAKDKRIIMVDSMVQTVIVCAYINMIFAQILALYWYANELKEQHLEIAAAAYETEWFTFKLPIQKNIQLLILRTQKPCSIKVGNMYLMTLELFQALLNASYSYFTLLKRVYG